MSEEEAPTIWLIVHSHQYDGWNGMEWSEEPAENAAYRGYFTSKEDAQAWIDAEKAKLVEEGRAKNDAELARKNADAERRYHEKIVQEEQRRVEHDALVRHDITPSFERPPERDPFTPWKSKFDEDVYLKGLGRDWEIIEVEPAREAVSHV